MNFLASMWLVTKGILLGTYGFILIVMLSIIGVLLYAKIENLVEKFNKSKDKKKH